MRYVIGRMTVRPGKRDEFLGKSAGYVSASRAEEDCVYYEQGPMHGNPDGIVLVECWKTAEGHAAHLASAYAKAFGPTAQKYILRGEFQEMDVNNPNNVVLDFGP